jgi:hypothetical protein
MTDEAADFQRRPSKNVYDRRLRFKLKRHKISNRILSLQTPDPSLSDKVLTPYGDIALKFAIKQPRSSQIVLET